MAQTTVVAEAQQMTVDEKERALFRAHAGAIEAEAKAIIADCKTKEGVERAAAWRVSQRQYMEQVSASPIAKLKEYYREKWAGMNEEYKAYVEPCKLWMSKVKERMDAWYAAEADRVRLAQIKANAKAIAKAEDHRDQKVQLFMELGKPKQAQVAAQKPLVVAPPVLQMPKIKGAVWKKKFTVQIEDLGALLAYLARKPQYHRMIEQAVLTTRLEGLAIDLDGNMKEFPGISCCVTPSSEARKI